MAEAFARRALATRPSAPTVSSSGLITEGRPPPDEVLEIMGDRGIDLGDHRSRLLDADVVANADLLIGMERRHLTEVVAIDADAYRRSFTLPEFVRWLDGFESDGLLDLDRVLADIAEHRGRRDLLRITIDEEIPDPMGHPIKFFERVAAAIEDLVERMVGAFWVEDQPKPTVVP